MTNTLSSVVVLLATLTTGVSSDDSVPERSGNYEFSHETKVEGTTWEGRSNLGVFIVRFERGGVLSYTSPGGTYRNGTWRQLGNVIYLEMNNHYADYRGEIRGDRLVGEASNKVGAHWKWDVKRTTDAK
jgi:hypothetical protein